MGGEDSVRQYKKSENLRNQYLLGMFVGRMFVEWQKQKILGKYKISHIKITWETKGSGNAGKRFRRLVGNFMDEYTVHLCV